MENLKEINYTVKEFFNDQSFQDYDIVESENFDKAIKANTDKIHRNIGILVAQRLMEMGRGAMYPVVKEFREYIDVSEDDVFKIIKGEYELDLKTIARMEKFLDVELFKVI